MFRGGSAGPEGVGEGATWKAGEGPREGLRREPPVPVPVPPLEEGTPLGRGRKV